MDIQFLKQPILIALALVISQSTSAALNSQPQITKGIPETREVMVKKNEKGVRELDMTNRKQYQLVKSRLQRANMHKDKYPQLHRSLNIQKQQQAKKHPIALTQAMETTSVVDEEQNPIIQNAHLFLDVNVAVSEHNGQPYLIVRAKSSVQGGSTESYIDLLIENEDWEQLAPMGATLSVADGKDTLATSMVSLATLQQQHPDLDMIFASSYVQSEASDGTITSAIKFTQYPFSWSHIVQKYGHLMASASNNKQANKSAPVTSNLIGIEYEPIDPTDRDDDGVIKVCLNRGHSDCDYSAFQPNVGNGNTGVYIPFNGKVTVPLNVERIIPTNEYVSGVDEATNIYIQEGYYGGATKQSYKELTSTPANVTHFSDYLSFTVNEAEETTTIEWNIERKRGYFGNALLFSNIAKADWYIVIAVEAWVPSRRNPEQSHLQAFQVALTSVGIPLLNDFFTPVLPKLRFGYSCLAKGTMITMADGSEKPIEQILTGQMVTGALAQNPATAQPMKVVDVSIGIETLDMIRVKGTKNSNILMTETHPVSTANKGIVWAKELEKGDRIFTAKGTVMVISVAPEQYDDNVYNLKLAADNTTEGHDLGMFANGLLVGDLATQDAHNYKDQELRESLEEILQRVDDKWKTDYLNSLEDNRKQ